MKVEELISYAFKKIGFVFAEENLKNEKYAEALYYLNEELSTLSAAGVLIPNFTKVSFNFVSGKSDYSIGLTNSDVIAEPFNDIDYVNVVWDNVIRDIPVVTRKARYLGISSTQGVSSPPWQVLFLRNNFQSILSFMQPPDTAMLVNVYGKQNLTKFAKYQEITNIPEWYLKYFRLACAKQLASQYVGLSWTDVDESEFLNLKKQITSANDIDMDIINSNALLWNDGFSRAGYPGIYG